MGFSDNVREGTIDLLLKSLKTETNPKKIERGVKALMKYGLTQEDIDKRLSEIAEGEEVQESTESPNDKGYKKGNFNSGDQVYVLACTHQIRAKKQVGIFSKGMLGKTVWCDVCNANRIVTSQPKWVQ
jgi:hypothetical protein